MFCKDCGQSLQEGVTFCTSCGVPLGQTAETPVLQGTDPAATATTASSETPSIPGAYGAGWAPSPGQPAAGPSGAGWQPPQGPPAKPKRTGLIVGSVIAAIIVLAGAGVGIWLALRGDGGTTTAGATVTTSAGDGSVEGLDGESDASDGTAPGGAAAAEYLTAIDDLVTEMYNEDARMPALAVIINDNLPDVPAAVHDELQSMADTLETVSGNVESLPVPEGYEDANYWLLLAATHMANRIQATIDGIVALWYAGSAGDAFDLGRAERDAYRNAIEQYYGYVGGD